MTAFIHDGKPERKGPSRRQVLLGSFFFLFLYPYSISVGDQGVSANYGFVLVPLFYCLARGRIKKPPDIFLLMMVLFAAIFAIGTSYQVELYPYFPRRLGSFILFMSLFSYMFMRIDAEMIAAFKGAVVAISVYLSIVSYIAFLGVPDEVQAVGMIGSQRAIIGSHRFGFVFVMAVWIVFKEWSVDRPWTLFRYPLLFVLTTGVLLTLSRASIIALLGSFGVFASVGVLAWITRPQRFSRKQIASVVLAGLLIFTIVRILPAGVIAAGFYAQRLFSLLVDPATMAESLGTTLSSEGYRLEMMKLVANSVIHNPLTGSGYLGVWTLFLEEGQVISGSAHSQYLDVLFRTGMLGFALYLFLLVQLLWFLYVRERALFWGIVGVLIFGLAQETFKESHGAFVLAFLLGTMTQRPVAAGITQT